MSYLAGLAVLQEREKEKKTRRINYWSFKEMKFEDMQRSSCIKLCEEVG